MFCSVLSDHKRTNRLSFCRRPAGRHIVKAHCSSGRNHALPHVRGTVVARYLCMCVCLCVCVCVCLCVCDIYTHTDRQTERERERERNRERERERNRERERERERERQREREWERERNKSKKNNSVIICAVHMIMVVCLTYHTCVFMMSMVYKFHQVFGTLVLTHIIRFVPQVMLRHIKCSTSRWSAARYVRVLTCNCISCYLNLICNRVSSHLLS